MMAQKRKISSQLIDSVSERRFRVVERLKEYGYIKDTYEYENDSSEYDSDRSDEHATKVLQVCENCYFFYVNTLKVFDLDNFGNLIEKKSPISIKTVKNFGSGKAISSPKNKTSSPVKSQNRESPIRNIIK